MAYVVTEACIDVQDRACMEECPVDCIYPGERMMYIHPDECVDCGKCMPACPSEAIHWEHKMPAEQLDFVEANALFVREQGFSGGGEDADPADGDHPIVAQRKPR
ncbi:4Fe-4S dicluster domain-containing protein [Pseudonocardia sp. EV170527-09]|uniref:ferredoxin n=1 Tax=Pseudonocardia sp. EV170527-09 TaxID=2603411 RepID=UPI0011F1DDFA|nr:ferredoxin [Pseudonocardia sp. EV170527-09]KAA1025245.1 4Fe-4S dicluster domain-containing protein [Pseudonocardia sp. EV170527-09]